MIVWLTGCTTSGKTWLGDFLQCYHGYTHVEGDRRLFVERDSEVSLNIVKAFYEYWFLGKEAPLELWVEYFQQLVDEASDALKKDPDSNVVISFSTYPCVVRDFLRTEIKKKIGKELTFVALDVSFDEYVKRNIVRFKDFVKNSGKSLEEQWESNEKMKKIGSYSEDNLVKYFTDENLVRGMEPLDKNNPNNHTINANENHRHVVPEISRILNLPVVENVDVEKVKQVQLERWTRYTKMYEERQSAKVKNET